VKNTHDIVIPLYTIYSNLTEELEEEEWLIHMRHGHYIEGLSLERNINN
jgi:hypothetical protein